MTDQTTNQTAPSTATYRETFRGWRCVDLTVEQAEPIVARLLESGAGFAVTSEPGAGRRIYWMSETAEAVLTDLLPNVS